MSHPRRRILAAAIALALVGTAHSLARATDARPTKTFEMVASRYAFDPQRIEVDQGDRVVVKLRSADTVHGFAVKEFKVKVAVPKTGEVVTAEFVAHKAGTYRFTCSEYCGSGHSRMKGVLLVRPAGGAR